MFGLLRARAAGAGFLLPLVAFVAGGLPTVMSPASARAQEVYRLPGDRVSVYNLAGRVEILPGEGPEVTVEVVRGGKDGDALEVRTGKVGGRSSLQVVYPADRIVYERMGWGSRTQIRVRKDGTFGDRGWSLGGGHRVRISGSGRGLEAYADLRILVPAGKDVAVMLAVGRMDAVDLEADILMDTGSGKVTVQNVVGDVDVDTGSGSVVVEDVEGEVKVDTGSGEVEISGIRGNRVFVNTGSGSVTGSGVEAESLEIDTGSGSVELDRVSAAEISVDTGSGEVELSLLSDVDRLMVDTGSGGVVIEVPEELGALVEIDTGSGGIQVDVPFSAVESKRSYLRGRLGDGEGTILIETGSGGVRLRRS